MQKKFSSLIFYTFNILEGNYLQYKNTVEDHVRKARHYCDFSNIPPNSYISLRVNGNHEIIRCIHNYVAAAKALVDHSRRIRKQLGNSDFTIEYDAKLDADVKNSLENLLVQALRNYILHRKATIPVIRFSESKLDFSLEFDHNDLGDFSENLDNEQNRQDPKIQEYVRNQILSHSSIPIGEIIDKHFSRIKEFYLWIKFREHQLSFFL